ncbi:MAG: transglutaminase-like domain-containing protein [Bacteroidales bacterium]
MTENKNTTELSALISLLDEPDKNMLNQIKEKIYSYGEEAIPILEQAWSTAINPAIQNRMEKIIHQIQKEKLCNAIDTWARLEKHDLLKGFILVSQFEYPELNAEKISRTLGEIIQEVWLELNNSLTPLEKIKVINHIIYDIQHFQANKNNIIAVDNCCLNKVLETRKGNALSLGILYIIISQALKIPVYGIDLPRHFVLSYVDEKKEDAPINMLSKKDILFYINPFYKGVVFSEKEISLFIQQLKIKPEDRFYLPTNNISIISRLLNELRYTYSKAKRNQRAKELDKIISIVQKYH